MKKFIVTMEKYSAFCSKRTAVVDEKRELSYRELHTQSIQLANYLYKEWGVREGEYVMVAMSNSVGFIQTIMALIYLNVTIVPINFESSAHIGYHYRVTNCRLFIKDQSILSSFYSDEMNVLDVEDALSHSLQFSYECEFFQSGEGKLEFLFFTSGTTGVPKGILLPAESLFIDALPNYYDENVVNYLMVRPLYFRSHLTLALNVLAGGNKVCLTRNSDSHIIYHMLEAQGITHMISGPTDIFHLTKWMEKHEKDIPSHFKEIMITGRTPSIQLKRKISDLMPNVSCIDFYGTSEAGGIASIDNTEWLERLNCSGKVDFYVDLQIMSPDGKPVAANEVGEVCVSSKYMMKEYYKDSELTNEGFFGKYLRTGDMGFLDDEGYLFLSGRKQDAINRRGVIFYALEVELITREIQGIEEVIVMGIHDEEQGQLPIAFLKSKDDISISENELLQQVHLDWSRLLPPLKIPVKCYLVEEMPFNSAGKIDKFVLLSKL